MPRLSAMTGMPTNVRAAARSGSLEVTGLHGILVGSLVFDLVERGGRAYGRPLEKRGKHPVLRAADVRRDSQGIPRRETWQPALTPDSE